MSTATSSSSPDGTVGYVFGYGSLSNRAEDRTATRAVVARLDGFRRVWNVAMDNAVTIPGYKYYVDPVSGERPRLFVTYLNLEPAPGVSCVGVVLPVSGHDLLRLDRRELNYRRTELAAVIRSDAGVGVAGPGVDVGLIKVRADVDPSLPVWTYLGTDAARARYERGFATGLAVIQREYLQLVERGFAARDLLGEYRRTTVPPACPIRSLRRLSEPGLG